MLGQPYFMLMPDVIGMKLTGALPARHHRHRPGAHRSRRCSGKKGVVDKFVEFYGPGLSSLGLADRATIANMAPEYGATDGLLPGRRRDAPLPASAPAATHGDGASWWSATRKEQGLFRTDATPDPEFTSTIELDLATRGAEPGRARSARRTWCRSRTLQQELRGEPARPDAAQRARRPAATAPPPRRGAGPNEGGGPGTRRPRMRRACGADINGEEHRAARRGGGDRRDHQLHQHLEPVGDDRRRPAGQEGGREGAPQPAVGQDQPGARARAWSPTTSTAPGCSPTSTSSASRRWATAAPPASATAARCRSRWRAPSRSTRLVVAAVLSGNRNFEARVHPLVRANYLASPMLVVAFALLGRVDADLTTRAARHRPTTASRCSCGTSGPAPQEITRDDGRRAQAGAVPRTVRQGLRRRRRVAGAARCPSGSRYAWDDASTYVQTPLLPAAVGRSRRRCADIAGARVLAVLGDSVTTDHISPAGAIPKNGPAAQYLARARRRAGGLEHLRRPARQPRSDDARHLRQRAHQERAGAGQGRQLDACTSRPAR